MKELKSIREALGLTPTTCARGVSDLLALEIPDHKWKRWEKLETDPDRDEREAIADFLGATLDQLAGRAPFHAPTPKAG